MHQQSTPIVVNPTKAHRHAAATYQAEMAAFRADAQGVHLVGVSLTFDDVFRIVLAVLAAQLLLFGIVGAVAGLLWLAVR